MQEARTQNEYLTLLPSGPGFPMVPGGPRGPY